jgi:Na+/proline symporter
LGNLPGQDLTQRIFSARSSSTAVWACHIAALLYFVLGVLPLMLGLAADLVAPEGSANKATMTLLAGLFLSPWAAVLFVLSVMSAVLATIDSALLSPASVLAQNVLAPRWPKLDLLMLNRWAVIGVTIASLITAYLGESAYSLLESAYALGLVSLLVPLLMGLKTNIGGERAALASMITGTLLWSVHFVIGWESFLSPIIDPLGLPLPVALSCALSSLVVYVIVARNEKLAHEDGTAA